MRKIRTRQERRVRRSYRLTFALSVLIWLVVLVYCLSTRACSAEPAPAPSPSIPAEAAAPQEDLCTAAVHIPAAEPVTYEDHFRDTGNMVEDCTITYYCAEQRPHICGTGDGLTATGTPVTPYWTCAVDPSVIPYGATVMVDWGESVAFYEAQDCGGAIGGNHIDLAVTTHAEALELGRKTATVYWLIEEEAH